MLISSNQTIDYQYYKVSHGKNEELSLKKIVYSSDGCQLLFVWADGKDKSYILIAELANEPTWVVLGEWELGLFKDFSIKDDKIVLCGSNGILCYNGNSMREPYGCILHKRVVRDVKIDNIVWKLTGVEAQILGIL